MANDTDLAAPTAAAIDDAQAVLRDYLPETRLVRSAALTSRLGAEVLLKLECELPTGSFKVRGALYALVARCRSAPVGEVVASSTGNHGAAVAWAARTLGARATIFLPEGANPTKRGLIRDLGASVREAGPDLAAAARAARAHAAAVGAYFLDDATDPLLPAGPATIAREVLRRAPSTRTFYVPMGDTALVRGIAAAAKQFDAGIRVVGVQAELAPAYVLSWRRGVAVGTATCATIADGLATRTPTAANVAAIRSLVDDVMLVSDDQMLAAMEWLLAEEDVVAEPAGAAATAAALAAGRLAGTTTLVVTGANRAPEHRGPRAPAGAQPASEPR